MDNPKKPADPAPAHAALIDGASSLMLATTTDDGLPHVSYTPFVRTGPVSFCIYVSELAAHTRHMLARDEASIMIIADEALTRQPFARVRVNYHCRISPIARTEAEYEPTLALFRERHGKMIELLRQLPDFHLLKLTAVSGQFVHGFGKAFKLAGPDLEQFEHTRTG